ILSNATVSSTVSTFDGYTVDAYALDGATLTAQALGPAVVSGGLCELDQVVTVGDIANSTMEVDESVPQSSGGTPSWGAADLPGAAGGGALASVVPGVSPSFFNFAAAFATGYEFIHPGGNIINSKILAGIGADVVSDGYITGTTIDTSLAGAMPSSWWGGYLGKDGYIKPGFVNVASKGDCNATVNAFTTLTVNCMKLSGSYAANDATSILAWGDSTPSQIISGAGVTAVVHGSLSGRVYSQTGAVTVSASGDVSANVEGQAVGVETLGAFSGNATSHNGAIVINAFSNAAAARSIPMSRSTSRVGGPWAAQSTRAVMPRSGRTVRARRTSRPMATWRSSVSATKQARSPPRTTTAPPPIS
ncbi:MAG: hypothetical protein ACREHD_01790, partial [Pirellulales bacterium]